MERINNLKEKRFNCGIDILKILCCIGVLLYHTADDLGETFATGITMPKLLYFAASFCIPSFFMISGYLFIIKKGADKDYVEVKIKKMFFKMLGWYTVWVTIHYAFTGEVLNLVLEVESGFYSSGILPVAWYLFTLILIYVLFSHLLFQAYKLYEKVVVGTIMLGMFCLVLYGSIAFDKVYYWEQWTQALWIIPYGLYFAWGTAIGNGMRKCKKFTGGAIGGIIFCNIVAFTFYLMRVGTYDITYTPSHYYVQPYYLVWITTLFVSCIYFGKIIENATLSKVLHRIAENTFSVYLSHLPILLALVKYKPLASVTDIIKMVIFLFITGNLLAELFRRMPLLRKIV